MNPSGTGCLGRRRGSFRGVRARHKKRPRPLAPATQAAGHFAVALGTAGAYGQLDRCDCPPSGHHATAIVANPDGKELTHLTPRLVSTSLRQQSA